MKKQWISVKCGLSRDPQHRRRMGKSVWTFLHMLDLADWQTGIVYDWKDENAAEDMGIDIRVLREDRRKLEEEDYISCRQKQHGQDITINNWTNPREYSGEVYNPKRKKTEPSNAQGYAQGDAQGDVKDVTPTSYSNIKESLSKRKEFLASSSIEYAILAGQSITPELAAEQSAKQTALVEFENALGISNPLQWDKNKDWEDFAAWVIERYKEDADCFKRFQAWRMTPFVKGAISNPRIRGFAPTEFLDSWDMFKMNDKPVITRPEGQSHGYFA